MRHQCFAQFAYDNQLTSITESVKQDLLILQIHFANNLYKFINFYQIIMQSFEDDQKGLFTFYREQADLQQQLKLYKKTKKSQKKDDKSKQINKNVIGQGSLIAKYHSKFDSIINQGQQNLTDIQPKQKKLQKKDKLLQLISKQNAYQYKNKKLQIFMNEYSQNKDDDASTLKKKLQKLHQEEEIDIDKTLNQKQTSKKIEPQIYIKKQSITKAYQPHPFQRLSIIPTNFKAQIQNTNNFDKKVPVFNPRKLFPKYSTNNLQIRKNDKVLHVSQSFNIKQVKPLPTFGIKQYISQSKESKKPYFPKIQVKSVCQILNKINKQAKYEQIVDHLNFNSKIIDNLGSQNLSKPILSQRYKRKNDISLLLESVKLQLQNTAKINRENKIHALFINNKLQQSQNKEKEQKKDIIYLDILKRMKFT